MSRIQQTTFKKAFIDAVLNNYSDIPAEKHILYQFSERFEQAMIPLLKDQKVKKRI